MNYCVGRVVRKFVKLHAVKVWSVKWKRQDLGPDGSGGPRPRAESCTLPLTHLPQQKFLELVGNGSFQLCCGSAS